jgi:hypothetical protein
LLWFSAGLGAAALEEVLEKNLEIADGLCAVGDAVFFVRGQLGNGLF